MIRVRLTRLTHNGASSDAPDASSWPQSSACICQIEGRPPLPQTTLCVWRRVPYPYLTLDVRLPVPSSLLPFRLRYRLGKNPVQRWRTRDPRRSRAGSPWVEYLSPYPGRVSRRTRRVAQCSRGLAVTGVERAKETGIVLGRAWGVRVGLLYALGHRCARVLLRVSCRVARSASCALRAACRARYLGPRLARAIRTSQ